MTINKPKICVAMAHCDDFSGVWSTVQSVFLHNEWDRPSDVEIILVDTSPTGSEHRKLVQDFLNKGGNDTVGCRTRNIKYIDMANFAGTTLPRDVVFEHSKADYVVVMDCHVMLKSNTLRRLLDWFEKNPECQDLIHGPMVYDNLDIVSTHFTDQFRGGMWGTWGGAWSTPGGTIFMTSNEEFNDEYKDENRKQFDSLKYFDIMTLKEFKPGKDGDVVFPCGHKLPSNLEWAGHDRSLVKFGCFEIGKLDSEDGFEIPGMGMGLFASRRDSWLGFNKDCTGFGGEEMNIHTKYRQAGRKAICLPFLKWNHRFGRAGGAPYPIPLAAKVRNYVLWANELNLPLDRIEKHFVSSGLFPKDKWEKLIIDPVNFHVDLSRQVKSNNIQALDALFADVARESKDLNVHCENVRNIASKVNNVTAFVKRADWEVALAAGFPKVLKVYQSQDSNLIQLTHKAVDQQKAKDSRKIDLYETFHKEAEVDPMKVEILPTELLVIDRENSAEYLTNVLNKHASKVSRYILIRGTQSFGEKSEFDQTKPGLWPSMKNFLSTNKEWFIAQHWPAYYGLTLLAKDPEKRPDKEITPWPLGKGPGTELKSILSSVGINSSPNCACNRRMAQMDQWGVKECKEHFDEIVGWINESAVQWGWSKAAEQKVLESSEPIHQLTMTEKLGIGWKSLMSGIAFQVNWLDPYPGLVTEAIRRAEEKEKDICKKNGCEPGAKCGKEGCKK
jgi:hypothetical protein